MASVLQLTFALGSLVIIMCVCRECLVPLIRKVGLMHKPNDDDQLSPPSIDNASAPLCLVSGGADRSDHLEDFWFDSPEDSDQRHALLVALLLALPLCLKRRLPSLVIATTLSLLCMGGIFGVFLAEWVAASKNIGDIHQNLREGVDCAMREPVLLMRATTAFVFTCACRVSSRARALKIAGPVKGTFANTT